MKRTVSEQFWAAVHTSNDPQANQFTPNAWLGPYHSYSDADGALMAEMSDPESPYRSGRIQRRLVATDAG